jgi:hypothetical protein
MILRLSKKQNVKPPKNFQQHLQMFMLVIKFMLKMLVQVVIEFNL